MNAAIKRARLLSIIVKSVKELATLYLQEGMTQRDVLDRINAELAEESERWKFAEVPNNHLPGDPLVFIPDSSPDPRQNS